MLLDCRNQATRMVPMTDPTVTVLIINSNVKHELTGGEYAERRRQCEAAAKILQKSSLREATLEDLERNRANLDDVHFRRARHVISEIARTTQAADALAAGNWTEVGALMYGSHDSLRDDYEVSCVELDAPVEEAHRLGSEAGVIGSRMTGGALGARRSRWCTPTRPRSSPPRFATPTTNRPASKRRPLSRPPPRGHT